MAWKGIFEFKDNLHDKLGNIAMSGVGNIGYDVGYHGKKCVVIANGGGNYLSLNSNQYPPPASPTLHNGQNAYSYSVWTYFDQINGTKVYLSGNLSGTPGQHITLDYQGNNIWKISFVAFGEPGNGPFYQMTINVPTIPGWHCIGFSYSGNYSTTNSFNFYFDGNKMNNFNIIDINRYYPDFNNRNTGQSIIGRWQERTQEIRLAYLHLSTQVENDEAFKKVWRDLQNKGCILSLG